MSEKRECCSKCGSPWRDSPQIIGGGGGEEVIRCADEWHKRLAAAQPPRIVRNLTMEDAEEIDKILERHKTDEFDSFNAADALNDFLFGGVNYPGIFKDPAAQPRLTKERIENVIRTILVNRHVDVEGAVEFAKNALVPQPATQFTQPTIETFSEPPAIGPNVYRDPDTGRESILGASTGQPPATEPTLTEERVLC